MQGPAPFDPEIPSIARTYDYLLGGKDNYPADREVGEIFIQRFPGAVQIALDNRGCLVRAVDYMAREVGLDQFIDLGSGLPTADNVHQVAQRVNPRAGVVYVDNDPIVLAHGRALLVENQHTTVLRADIRQPEQILKAEELRALVDLDRPVGIIASAILHHITDDEDPLGLIRTFRAAAPAGSCLFVSHFRTLGDPASAALEEVMLDHHLPEPELQLITIDATRIQAIRDGYIAGIKQQAPAFAEQLAEALDNVDQLNVDQCRDLCALLQLAHETLARMRRPI